MSVLRYLYEGLFRVFFTTTRIACFAQAVALLTAVFVSGAWSARDSSPPWVRTTLVRGVLLLVTFLTTAVLLHLISWRRVVTEDEGDPESSEESGPVAEGPGRNPWLALSMAALAALALWQAGDLLALWREIAVLLEKLELEKAFARGADPFAGVIFAPVIAVLYAPALEAIAAFLLIAVPVALLGLLALQSPSFPRMYFLMATCQTGLVLAAVIAADLFAHLSNEITPILIAEADVEGIRVANELARGRSILVSTGTAFLLPLAGYLAWVPALLRARSSAARDQMPSVS